MIRTENLEIGYSSSLLKVENLALNAEKVYFLIGRNGAGKSTFLKTILGQLKSISGKVFLEEQNIESIDIAELPKKISFVTAHFPSVDFLRVEEFIALGRSPHSNYFGKQTQRDLELIDDCLSILNIENLKGRFTSELSDGEKQLVAIAKSLAQETDVILLDEPTAFLDYANKKIVLNSLSKVSKELGKCIILSNHDIDLCVEHNGEYLIVDSIEKTITHHSTLNKERILEIAFR